MTMSPRHNTLRLKWLWFFLGKAGCRMQADALKTSTQQKCNNRTTAQTDEATNLQLLLHTVS